VSRERGASVDRDTRPLATHTPSRSQLGAGATDRSPATICYNCRQEGHIASQCPKIGYDGSASRRASSPRP
jgi:hypothetical protein